MGERPYRVIQWATGSVGKAALKHFIRSPAFDVVGVLVYDPKKIGKDAGDIVGAPPTGVLATDDVDAVIAMDADCVFYTPVWPDSEIVCRLLRSGKNVVTTAGIYHPTEMNQLEVAKIEEACREGGTSYHAGGIHPGFAGDLLPLIGSRLVSRVDQVQVFEVVNFSDYPSKYIELIGLGTDPDVFHSRPNLLEAAVPHFAQSMAMVASGLGEVIDNVTSELDIAVATADIPYAGTSDSDVPDLKGVVRAGTVAAQHHTWTGWSGGAPLVQFNALYTMGDGLVEPDWRWGTNRYRVVIKGDPSTEITLRGAADRHGHIAHPGYAWTAMSAVNVIPAVCKSEPGFKTHLDLGAIRIPGLTGHTLQ
ncbi:dihydrodipicolinate reductase [Mycobacterium sp. E802]|uniref:NAD(P)H-dependent amine dehydrogenase family protein n=1 Tax=Mycobacterium sp. E802 TaxID=1834152 RepID=UPI0007FF5A55|nr:dihydrodipicolinate reductase [Mycobacterium sp. E802]OBG86340.1 dihydrodipicolinate reductase [Mycobacterium sp. E802]